MQNEEFKKKEEAFKMIVKKIQNSGLHFPDIREKEWLKTDSKASELLKLLIAAENILIDLDEYQMEYNQCYPEIEDMMLQLGELRNTFTNFIDNNLDLLKLK